MKHITARSTSWYSRLELATYMCHLVATSDDQELMAEE